MGAESLAAPDVIHAEVASGIRSLLARRELDARRATEAMADLIALPIRVTPHRVLLPRCWELRDTLTIYDASYIALAEALDVVLVTADRGMARSRRRRCRVELLR